MLNYVGIGLLVVVVADLVPVTRPLPPPRDKDRLQGTWTLVKGEKDGKALDDKDLKDGKLVLKGDEYEVTLDGKTVKGKETLDESKNPRTIDIEDADGPNKGKKCEGIYELKGDEFRVCFAPPGKPRPTKFATEKDSGQWIHVWKREKK